MINTSVQEINVPGPGRVRERCEGGIDQKRRSRCARRRTIRRKHNETRVCRRPRVCCTFDDFVDWFSARGSFGSSLPAARRRTNASFALPCSRAYTHVVLRLTRVYGERSTAVARRFSDVYCRNGFARRRHRDGPRPPFFFDGALKPRLQTFRKLSYKLVRNTPLFV